MEKNNNPSDYQKAYLEELGISFSDNIDDFNNDSSEYIKIDPSIIGMVDAALQAIPNVLLECELNADTYRVIYDKGLGTLQKAADYLGFYRGNVVPFDKNNAIRGGVLMQELSLAPQIISGVFSAMSMVTGQYYMSQINNKLDSIEKSVAGIQMFLEDDKRSKLESAEEFLKHIQKNYQSIVNNDDMRNASLNTVQKIKIDALANIIFYKKQIKDLEALDVKHDKFDDIIQNINRISFQISEYWYSLYLYCFASYLEPVIARNTDIDYIRFVKDDMSQKCEQYKEDYKKWHSKLNLYIEEAKAFDENIILKAAKNPNLMGGRNPYAIASALAIRITAEVADSVDKKRKTKKKTQASNDLEKVMSCEDIYPIETKIDDLAFYETINNGRIELVKKDDELYLKLPQKSIVD